MFLLQFLCGSVTPTSAGKRSCCWNPWIWSRIWTTFSSKFPSTFRSWFFPEFLSRFWFWSHLEKDSVQQVIQQLLGMVWLGPDGQDASGSSCWDLQLCEISEETEPPKMKNSELQHTFRPAELRNTLILFLCFICQRQIARKAVLTTTVKRTERRDDMQQRVPGWT